MTGAPFDADIRVGRVLDAKVFTEARKPGMIQLRIDLGDRTVQSAAQLAQHYAPEDLVGRLVLCALGLGTVRIAGFDSEVLTVGVNGADGFPVLVVPDKDVPLGGRLH